MKKTIYLLLLIFPISLFSQTEKMNYKQTQDISFTKNYKNYHEITEYITKDGLKIKIGDKLIIGEAFTNKKKEKKNNIYDKFKNITVGKVKKSGMKNCKYLPANEQGTEVIVKKIFVTHQKKGDQVWGTRKNTPLYVSIYVKEEGKKFYKGTTLRTIIDIEKAIETGEIVSKNKKITREEAIKKLREAKDLLVIEVITQAEYDKLEKELMPIIKKEE